MDEDMDEDYEPILPRASEPPALKRLWVAPPEPEEVGPALPSTRKKTPAASKVEPPEKLKKPKKKKAEAEDVIDDGTGATKLEATPALDTYEARQTARWLLGGTLAVILFVGVVITLNAFKGSGNEEVRTDPEPTEIRGNSDARDAAEREARIMLDLAKQSDRLGKTKAALEQLNKVVKFYKGSAAAREALAALDRYKREKSLFGEEAPNQVGDSKPPPPGSAPGPVPPRVDGLATSPANSVGVKPPGGNSSTTPPPATVAPPVRPILTKPLPIGYRAKFDYPIHPSGWPTRIACEKDGAELVLVPAAAFIMGRPDGEEEQEKPAHEVAVSTYYIDLHEVTVGQYLRFLKDSGRALDVVKIAGNGKPADDLPMVNVSSKEAAAYCTWARRRLPTEAEWELAARGPEGKISYWHEQLPRPDPEKGDRKMEPVMSLKDDLSPYGAFDMAANAWEWTSEFYDSRYYRQFRNLVQDPTGPKVPPSKPAKGTVKGGSSRGILTWREGQKLEVKLPYVGFRGALRADGSPLNPVVAPPPANVGPAGNGGIQPF